MTQKPENKFYEKLIMEEQSQNEIQEMIRDLQGCLKKKDEELWSAKSEYEKIVLKNEALKGRIQNMEADLGQANKIIWDVQRYKKNLASI